MPSIIDFYFRATTLLLSRPLHCNLATFCSYGGGDILTIKNILTMQKLNSNLSGGLYVINHKLATSPSPNRPRQLHINYTWSEADERKKVQSGGV